MMSSLNELQFERHLSSKPDLALPECMYWIRKLQARFVAGDYTAAIEAAKTAQRLFWTSHYIHFSGWRSITFIARLPAQHAAIPQAPASGSSIWRP